METEIIVKKRNLRPEHPWVNINGDKKFKKGNPGRPKGILNKDTQARNAILEKFLYREGELSKIEFKQLLQAVVTLLPKKFQGEGFSSKDLTYIYYGDRKKELENLNTGRSLSTP